MKKNQCPICGQTILDEFDICEVCGWENDLVQLAHPDFPGGANQMSINEAREAWTKGEQVL